MQQKNHKNPGAIHGWLVIDKPAGPSSNAIVTAVKRALKEGGYAKVKIGHAGTLDPAASGVLPIALGEATKLAGQMLNADKIYAFTCHFGAKTDTLDSEGTIIDTSPVRPSRQALEAVLPRFTGTIIQTPPVYSAIKIGGKPAYALARAGKKPEMRPRSVIVHSLSLMKVEEEEAAFTARVSKGTYIRTLACDIADAAGAMGYVSALRRLKAGPFTLPQAISLDKLNELAKGSRLEQALLPLAAGLDDIPALSVTPDQARLLRQGQKVIGIAAEPGFYLATDHFVPVALVELSGNQHPLELRVVRGFNL